MSNDVVFTYNGQATTLRWADRIASREALGLWHVGSQAWKVYRTRNVLPDLRADYTRAATDGGLPMGSPQFREGQVKQGTAAATNGFVLLTVWMTGTNFQKTQASFRTALTRQNIPHAKTNEEYKRVLRGCTGANVVGLRDCQGFVQTGISEPVRFIDVHTGWNKQTNKYDHSEQAQGLVDAINAWGTQP